MKNTIQVFVSFAVSTVVLLLGLYVLLGVDIGQWQVVKDARMRLAERQAVMDQLTDLISKFRERVASFDNLNTQIDLVDTALPSSLNVPQLLVSFETIAAESQVTIESVSFISIDVLSNQGAPAAKDSKKARASEPLPLQISLSGSGNYKAVKGYLKGLEEELRLMEIQNITFRPMAASGAESKKGAESSQETNLTFSFQVNLITYYIEKPSFTLP